MLNRLLIRIAAVVVLALILLVFVAPSIDLEPTALRARQAAQMLLASITSYAFLFAGLSLARCMVTAWRRQKGVVASLQDLNCTRLC